jgi:hypothetical protein
MVKKSEEENSHKFSLKNLLVYLGLPLIESLLIFIFGWIVSYQILFFGNFSYYGYSFLAFLPFLIYLYLLYKKKELYTLFEKFGWQTIWFVVMWLGQLIPAFIFTYLLPNLHQALISTTVLATILTVYLSYAITLFFFYYFFRKFRNLKLLLFAIIGLVLATLFIQNNNIGSEFGFILQFEAIFISLVPVLFGFLYNVYKEKKREAEYIFNQFIMTESFAIFSLITLLLAYLVNNAIAQGTTFHLATLTTVQLIFIGLLTLTTSFLFVFLISIILLLFQLRNRV